MKNLLNFKWLLLSFILSIASINQVWAYNVWDAHVYFDNTNSNWDVPPTKSVFIILEKDDNGTKGSAAINMSVITGTKLLYWSDSWGDEKVDGGTRFASCKYNEGGYDFETNESWKRVNNNENCYGITGTLGSSTPDGQNDSWLYVSASGTYNNTSAVNLASTHHLTGGYTDLNFAQTIKKYTASNTSFSESSVNSGTVTISAYQMTAHGTASDENNSATLDEASETSTSVDAVYTGVVTLTASANEGFVFLGWYDDPTGEAVETSTTYTYRAPRSTKTVYALFAPKLRGTLYLKTNGTSGWRAKGGDSGSIDPHFDAVFKNASTSSRVTCSSTGVDDYYSVTVPEGNWYIVEFERMPDTGDRWNHSGEFYDYGTRNCVKITGWDAGEWCRYAPTPAVAGTMNDWSPVADQFELKDGTYTLKLDLAEGTAYNFKVASGIDADNEWLGKGSTNSLTFVGQTDSYTLVAAENNIMIFTADAGKYTFEWKDSELKVTYPIIKHPSTKYVYLLNTSWNSGSYCYLHHWYTVDATDYALTTSTNDPKITSKVTINATSYYYFPILTNYPNFIGEASQGTTDPNYKSSDLVTTDHNGKHVSCPASTWNWDEFEFTVTLDEQITTIDNNQNVEFNGAALSSITPPSLTGYTFDGYWSNEACNKVKVINSNGSWVANASGYTSSGKWIHAGGTATLYAKWDPEPLTFNPASGTDWGTATNWTPNCVPTIGHDVTIQKAVVVNSAAFAKSVLIDQSSSSNVKLTINAGKSLVIAGELKKTTDGSTKIATASADVVLHSALYTDDGEANDGNAALIVKTHDGTNEATVNFATKAYKKEGESGNWVNQYIGTPFNDQGDPTYNYYGMELYEFLPASQAWASGLASSMTPFRGYDLLSNSSTQNVVLNMTGTLVASTSTTPSQSVSAANQEVMFANSWVAPIDIASLSKGDIFTNSAKTIYIFNAGTLSDYNTNTGVITSASKSKTSAGQYTAIAVDDIPSGYKTIPSMQAFSLLATSAGSVSLALDYETHVYTPATSSVTIEPAHAPRRNNAVNEPTRTIVYVVGESGYGDNLRILEREDFTTDFDNGWEGQKLYGIPETPQLYALNEDRQMAIIALPDVDNTVLGFQAGTEDSQYTFLFDYEGEEELYLYDTQAEKETRITNDATYSFTTTDKVAHNRFVIRKSAKMPTGVENTTDEGVKTVKFIENGELYILRDGKLYNATGALVK